MSHERLRLLVCTLLTFAVLRAEATTFVGQDLPTFVRDADLVVVGKVKQLRAGRLGTMIYTYARVQVEETVTGENRGTEVVLVLPGGVSGDQGIRIHGSPPLRLDERCVFFLEGMTHQPPPELGFEGPYFRILGLGTGRYRIVTDPATGEDVVVAADPQTQGNTAGVKAMRTEQKGARRLTDLVQEIKGTNGGSR